MVGNPDRLLIQIQTRLEFPVDRPPNATSRDDYNEWEAELEGILGVVKGVSWGGLDLTGHSQREELGKNIYRVKPTGWKSHRIFQPCAKAKIQEMNPRPLGKVVMVWTASHNPQLPPYLYLWPQERSLCPSWNQVSAQRYIPSQQESF